MGPRPQVLLREVPYVCLHIVECWEQLRLRVGPVQSAQAMDQDLHVRREVFDGRHAVLAGRLGHCLDDYHGSPEPQDDVVRSWRCVRWNWKRLGVRGRRLRQGCWVALLLRVRSRWCHLGTALARCAGVPRQVAEHELGEGNAVSRDRRAAIPAIGADARVVEPGHQEGVVRDVVQPGLFVDRFRYQLDPVRDERHPVPLEPSLRGAVAGRPDDDDHNDVLGGHWLEQRPRHHRRAAPHRQAGGLRHAARGCQMLADPSVLPARRGAGWGFGHLLLVPQNAPPGRRGCLVAVVDMGVHLPHPFRAERLCCGVVRHQR
mmetsp:Transcript_104045/g.293416  ORF Transcript_104045/g.293416 Transcript_104045/m.293416 type:complete len:317 (+) Transcript_104045:317-1267(+)